MKREESYSPSAVIRMITSRPDSCCGGLHPWVEAVSLARREHWDDLEREGYLKLADLLGRCSRLLGPCLVNELYLELSRTNILDKPDPVIQVLLKTLSLAPRSHHHLTDLAGLFDRWARNPVTAWPTRVYVGEFLNRLSGADPELGEEYRMRLLRLVPEWALDYHTIYAVDGFDVRSRGMFASLLASPWSEDWSWNECMGLDGAFACAVTKLMEASELAWFEPFLKQWSPPVAQMRMFRRLAGATLFGISETIARARRVLYQRKAGAAAALAEFEEAIHRPHRLNLERHPSVRLELELPGRRGFDGSARLQIHDISRDGCLAWVAGNARFEETACGETLDLVRAFGRSYHVARRAGLVRLDGSELPIRPGTELMLQDPTRPHGHLDIDEASLVRWSEDPASGRLWLAFHFDKVIPKVQKELDRLVSTAV